MPTQASFSETPEELERKIGEDFLQDLHDDIDDVLSDEEKRPRLERNFGGTNVFFQSSDYNVFASEDKIVFGGLSASKAAYLDGKNYDWKDEESSEVLELLADTYDIQSPLEEIEWY